MVMGFAHQRPDGALMMLPAGARASVGAPRPARAGAAATAVAASGAVSAAPGAAAAPGAVSAAPGALFAGGASAPEGLLFELLLFIFSNETLRVPLFRRSRLLGFKVNDGHSVLDKSVVDLKDLDWFSI